MTQWKDKSTRPSAYYPILTLLDNNTVVSGHWHPQGEWLADNHAVCAVLDTDFIQGWVYLYDVVDVPSEVS